MSCKRIVAFEQYCKHTLHTACQHNALRLITREIELIWVLTHFQKSNYQAHIMKLLNQFKSYSS